MTIITKNGKYLIDAGVPVDALITRKGIKFEEIDAVFITHMHVDHVGGLPVFIKSYIKYPHQNQTEVFLPEDRIDELIAWMSAMRMSRTEDKVNFVAYLAGAIYDNGDIKVTAIPTKHINAEVAEVPVSFAFYIEHSDKSMLYTGDLDYGFSDFPEIIKGLELDLCVCEVTHYDVDKALPVFKALKTKKLVLNHVGGRWEREGEKVLLGKLKELPYPCFVAHDGDEFLI